MTPDKKITRLADHLHFSNGVTLSPDDKTLYVGDFNAQEVIAVPIISPGVIDVGFAHVAAHLSGGWGTDGLATDADGNVYLAHYMGGEVVVLDPEWLHRRHRRAAGRRRGADHQRRLRQRLSVHHRGRQERGLAVKMNVERAKLP